jgi:hypothetical protein
LRGRNSLKQLIFLKKTINQPKTASKNLAIKDFLILEVGIASFFQP